MLAEIEAVHGQIRLGFDGQNAFTTGAGISNVGPYRIDADSAMTCKVVAPDGTGLVTETDIRFLDPNSIEVIDRRSQTPGRSTMIRVPQGQ